MSYCLDVGKVCTRCCKIEAVQELAKPANTWCKHVCPGGCGIYETRPSACNEYECLALQGYNSGHPLPPGLKPSECGAIMRATIGSIGIVVNVDDGVDWRKGSLGNFIKITSEQMPIIIRHRYNLKVVHRNILVAEDPNVDPNKPESYHYDSETMPLHPYTRAVP